MDTHEKKLTIQDLRPIMIDTIFRAGQFFTSSGREMDWVAVKLPHYRWAIYFTDSGLKDQKQIVDLGTLLKDDELIIKLVPCTTEVLEAYWKGGETET